MSAESFMAATLHITIKLGEQSPSTRIIQSHDVSWIFDSKTRSSINTVFLTYKESLGDQIYANSSFL